MMYTVSSIKRKKPVKTLIIHFFTNNTAVFENSTRRKLYFAVLVMTMPLSLSWLIHFLRWFAIQAFCLTVRVYLNTQKYGLLCSLRMDKRRFKRIVIDLRFWKLDSLKVELFVTFDIMSRDTAKSLCTGPRKCDR